MSNRYTVFKSLTRKAFKPLEAEFDIRLMKIEEDRYGCWVTFKNSTTAVRISVEPYESGIFVLIYKLVNGQIPAYEAAIKTKTVINSFYLGDILALRTPDIKQFPQIGDLFKPKPSELKSALNWYVRMLKENAADILQGDFKLWPTLEKIVKKRAQSFKKRVK